MNRSAPDHPGRRVIREPRLRQKLGGISGMTIRRWEKEAGFPRRFKLNSTGGAYSSVGWDEAEVDQWLDQRLASRDAAAA